MLGNPPGVRIEPRPASRALVAAALALAAIVAANTASAERLQEALRDVLRTHPEVLAAAANVRVARQGYEQAGAGRFPTIDLRAGAGPEQSDNTTTRILGQSNRTLTRQEAGLTLRQNLFDASQVRSQMESQGSRTDAAQARLGDAAELLAFRTAEAYLDSLRDGRLLKLARENVARHEETFEKTRLRFKSGVGQRADLTQAEGRLALARSSLVGAQGSERDSAARYQRIVGRYPDRLEAPDSPGKALPGALDAARMKALSGSYGLAAAQDELKAAQATVRAVRSDLAPRVDAELAANRNRDLDGVRGPNHDLTAMIVMRYNLFRGGADEARVKEAIERETVAMENVRNAMLFTEESVTRSWHALATARDRLRYLEGHVRATEQVLAAYQSQFELGRRSLLDVLNAENELFQARSALTSGLSAFQLGEFRLLAAMGILVSTLGLGDEIVRLDVRER